MESASVIVAIICCCQSLLEEGFVPFMPFFSNAAEAHVDFVDRPLSLFHSFESQAILKLNH